MTDIVERLKTEAAIHQAIGSGQVSKNVHDTCYEAAEKIEGLYASLSRYIAGECTCPDNPNPDRTHFPGCPKIAQNEITALRSRVERLEHEKEAAKDAYTDLEQYALYTDVSAKPPIGKLVAILYLPVQAPGGKPKVHAGRWSGEHWFFLDHDKMLRVIKEVLAWKNIDPIYSAEELPPTQENDDE